MLEQLIEAMRKGQILEAERLIERMKPEDFIDTKKADRNNPHYTPLYPLYYAAELGQNNLAELMLNKNPLLADKVRSDYGGTALHPAARDGNVKLVKLLLDKMSSETIFTYSYSPLDLALARKHEQVVELLVENAAVIKGVNKSNNKGILYLLAEKGYYKIAGVISPEKLISMLNPQDKTACDPSTAETLYKAVFAYDVDINFHPEVADNYFRKANILYAIGKKEEAIKCYNKAIGVDFAYISKIAANVQELLAGSNSKNQSLIDFLDHIKDLRAIVDTSDLESKEAPTMKLTHEFIKQKSLQVTNELNNLKTKVSQITEDIDALELNFNSFIKSLGEDHNEGQIEHYSISQLQLTGETSGDISGD